MHLKIFFIKLVENLKMMELEIPKTFQMPLQVQDKYLKLELLLYQKVR